MEEEITDIWKLEDCLKLLDLSTPFNQLKAYHDLTYNKGYSDKLVREEMLKRGVNINDLNKSEKEIGLKKNELRDLKDTFLSLIKEKKWDDSSELIENYILKTEKIYTTKIDTKSEVWIYKEGIYIPQGRSCIKEFMRNILGKYYSNWHYNNVIAKIEPDTFIDYDKFFGQNSKEEIPVLNGILNIKTKTLSEYSKDKIFFNKCPVIYNPESKCEKIDLFLSETLSSKEDKNVFYEFGGFCLLKEYTFEKSLMCVGKGRNGKGKCLELIKRVLGAENCFCLPLAALKHDNADVSQLFGKFVNMAGDIGNQDLKETGMFKSLTGRDLITTKRKFLAALTFENYAKFIFACNELPMVYDLSTGFWDRWLLLEFPYYFATREEFDRISNEDKTNWKIRDENIISKIATPEELSGLLNQFLEGLQRLFNNGNFSLTQGSEEIKTKWVRKANSFMAFCMDRIEESSESKIKKDELRKEYSKYCKEHKLTSKSEIVIKRVLQDMFGASDDRFSELFGEQKWYWTGVKWK